MTQFNDYFLNCEKKHGYYVIDCDLKNSVDILTLAQEIQKLEFVKCCQPGLLSEIRFNTNSDNPYFNNQYYLKNTPSTGATAAINAVKAWELISGSPDVTIAVIDDGVERSHEDLQAAIVDGLTLDFPLELGDPINDQNFKNKPHGTLCAGVIAAVDNNVGIKGVASGSKIMPINVYPYEAIGIGDEITWSGFCGIDGLADAIYWAEFNGADIINCSWSIDENSIIREAITYAINHGRNGLGCIVVASSGNRYSSEHPNANFPANIDDVLCVGAVTQSGSIWDFSQRGPKMDLVAPGKSIYTTDRSGVKGHTDFSNYIALDGTSLAAPQVAGVAALMLSANPGLTSQEVTSILRNSATDLGAPGFDTTYGYGLVNAVKAVGMAMTENLSISGPKTICPSDTARYEIANLSSLFDVDWYFSDIVGSCLPYIQRSNNSCAIYNDISKTFSGNLTADIRYDGILIKTIYKPVIVYGGFYGTYGNGQEFSPSSPAWATPGTYFTIKSPNFIDKNITFNNSLTLPTSYNFNSVTGSLSMGFPATYTTNPIMIYVQPRPNSNCCDNNYQILVMPTTLLHQHSISIYNRNNDNYEVRLHRPLDLEFEYMDIQCYPGNTSGDRITQKDWSIEIFNSSTGNRMLYSTIKEDEYTFNISSWELGTYIIRVVVADEILTEKIIKASK